MISTNLKEKNSKYMYCNRCLNIRLQGLHSFSLYLHLLSTLLHCKSWTIPLLWQLRYLLYYSFFYEISRFFFFKFWVQYADHLDISEINFCSMYISFKVSSWLAARPSRVSKICKIRPDEDFFFFFISRKLGIFNIGWRMSDHVKTYAMRLWEVYEKTV